MLGTFASRELLPNLRRAVGDFLGGHLGTVADWDIRKSEVIWGQTAACRAWDICDFEGVPSMSLDGKGAPPSGFAQGTVWAEGPSHRKFQGVKSPGRV